jgi:hypothetical protein
MVEGDYVQFTLLSRDYVSRKKEALSIWCLYRKAKQIIKKMFKIFL